MTDRLHQLFLFSCKLFLLFALAFLEGLLSFLLLLLEVALLLQSLLLLLLQLLLLVKILALEPLSCTLVSQLLAYLLVLSRKALELALASLSLAGLGLSGPQACMKRVDIFLRPLLWLVVRVLFCLWWGLFLALRLERGRIDGPFFGYFFLKVNFLRLSSLGLVLSVLLQNLLCFSSLLPNLSFIILKELA